uniref:Uncharacterized protein n=1 Tax=Arundo donax TaxID=35708 RepID=A0A0A9CGV0_ARUDO
MQSHRRDKISGKYSVRVTLSLLGISSQSSSYNAPVPLSSSNLEAKITGITAALYPLRTSAALLK